MKLKIQQMEKRQRIQEHPETLPFFPVKMVLVQEVRL